MLLFNKPKQPPVDLEFHNNQIISLSSEFEQIFKDIPRELQLDVCLLCDNIQYLANSMEKVSKETFTFGSYTFTFNQSGILTIEELK